MENWHEQIQTGFLMRPRGSEQFIPQPYPSWTELPPLDDSWDFGRDRQAQDLHTKTASTTADVLSAFEEAQNLLGGLHLRGAGHSMNGQTLPMNGLQLNLRFDNEDHDFEVDDSHQITVPGSASWESVLTVLEPLGRTIGVLTDHPETTVGGTLSVSGIGPASLCFGRQVDMVDRLQVVLPDGRVLWCSSDDHPEIFRTVLAGLGGIAVIRRAILNTIELLPYVVTVVAPAPGWREALESSAWLAKNVDAMPESLSQYRCGMGPANIPAMAIAANHYLFQFRTLEEAINFAEIGVDDVPGIGQSWAAARVETLENSRLSFRSAINDLLKARWTESPDNVVQLWQDFVFPDSDANQEFLSRVEPDLADQHFVESNFARWGSLIKEVPSTPHLPLSIYAHDASASSGYYITQGYYSSIPKANSVAVEQVKDFIRRAIALALELGGRPYLYGWNDLTSADMKSGYGESWDFYRDVKKSVDPDGIMSRGVFDR